MADEQEMEGLPEGPVDNAWSIKVSSIIFISDACTAC